MLNVNQCGYSHHHILSTAQKNLGHTDISSKFMPRHAKSGDDFKLILLLRQVLTQNM